MTDFFIPGVSDLSVSGSVNFGVDLGPISLGASVGASIGGNILGGQLGLGVSLNSNLGPLGPILNQVFGNFGYSASDGIDAMRRRGEPAFRIDWSINMPSLSFNTDISPYVEDVQFDHMAIEHLTVTRGMRTVGYVGRRDPQPVSLRFFEDAGHTSSMYLAGWRALCHDVHGCAQYPSTYKQTITVNLLDCTQALRCQVLLIGCFPIGQANYHRGSGLSEISSVEQQFNCDHVAFISAS